LKEDIVDVRDGDYKGGHIKGGLHYGSLTFDDTLPELVKKLGDTETVVVHCLFSQQRGPRCARKLLDFLETKKNRK